MQVYFYRVTFQEDEGNFQHIMDTNVKSVHNCAGTVPLMKNDWRVIFNICSVASLKGTQMGGFIYFQIYIIWFNLEFKARTQGV